MSVKELEVLVEKVRSLPEDKQREVIDFVEYLASRFAQPTPRKSLEGIWAGRVDISRADIDEARREMWGNFPREDIV